MLPLLCWLSTLCICMYVCVHNDAKPINVQWEVVLYRGMGREALFVAKIPIISHTIVMKSSCNVRVA